VDREDGTTQARDRYPSVEWKCPGLLSATQIDGTVNAAHDVDRAGRREADRAQGGAMPRFDKRPNLARKRLPARRGRAPI